MLAHPGTNSNIPDKLLDSWYVLNLFWIYLSLSKSLHFSYMPPLNSHLQQLIHKKYNISYDEIANDLCPVSLSFNQLFYR